MTRLAIRALPMKTPSLLKVPLPADRLATRPPEARGLTRDSVRLMVSHYQDDRISHHRFQAIPELLNPGDLLLVNTSATLPAALTARHADGRKLYVHLSTRRSASEWVIEVRTPTATASEPFAKVRAGDELSLPEGFKLRLISAYPDDKVQPDNDPDNNPVLSRLWRAEPIWETSGDWLEYLRRHGRPIRYAYVEQDWPLEAYQNVFAHVPGSAEMPSAGRAFTPELVTALVSRGIQVLPLVLHTGVSSPESHEAPYAEYYSVPEVTADAVNRAIQQGRRVIAVGTTCVRAIESAVDSQGWVQAESGWTDLVIRPDRGLQVVDGLLTGFHEPEASHLHMLEALTGARHLAVSYPQALERGYLWHEFGDLHLILP